LCVSAAAICALITYTFLPETMAIATADAATDAAANDQGLLKNVKAVFSSTNNNPNDTKSVVKWTMLLQDNRWKGLALCHCGTSFGFACKIASIPILATEILPGGAIGAGALLSAAGLSGLVGAPLGGWLTDQAGSRVTAITSGVVAALALMAIPIALSPSSAPTYIQDFLQAPDAITHTNIGDMDRTAVTFGALVVTWSTAVAAQGPAMTAFAQELAPAGSEATSLALPRAAGDGTYIIAPLILGLVADKASNTGLECAVAGSAALIGAVALGLLGGWDVNSDIDG